MFLRFAKITVIEHLHRALYAVNTPRGWRLRLPSVLVLVAIFKADMRGQELNQHRLMLRCYKFRNILSNSAYLRTLERLQAKGLIERRKVGRVFFCHVPWKEGLTVLILNER